VEAPNAPTFEISARWTLVNGSPLVKAKSGLWLWLHEPGTLVGLLSLPLALLFVPFFALWLGHPVVGLLTALVAGALLGSWIRAAAARRHAARVEVFADRIRFSSAHAEIVFLLQETEVTSDIWIGSAGAGRWAGSELWNVLILRSGDKAVSLGARGGEARPSRRGKPMHECKRATLESIATLCAAKVREDSRPLR
jgi:hypothetical protein